MTVGGMLCLIVLGFNINSLKEFTINLFSPGDKYLIIEILNHYLQVTLVQVNFETKQVRVSKNFLKDLSSLKPQTVLKELSQIIRKIRKPARYSVILNLDPQFATTIYSSLPAIRQSPSEVIDEADIDNLLSQTIWKFFDRQRLRVAKKMNVEEIDVLLSDVRVRGIKIDGHKVINPIGFKAKSVEFYLSQTFAPREFIRGLKEIIALDKITLISEIGTVLAHGLLDISKSDQLVLANLFPDKTILYAAAPGRLAHLDEYGWGQNHLLSALNQQLALDPESAQKIIDLHNENRASEAFLRRFETIIAKELQIFFNGLESIIDFGSAKIFLNPYFNLPALAFSPRVQNRLAKPLPISGLSTGLDGKSFGFEVKFKKSVKVKNLNTLLAAFREIGNLPKDDKLSYLAKRRVRWLS